MAWLPALLCPLAARLWPRACSSAPPSSRSPSRCCASRPLPPFADRSWLRERDPVPFWVGQDRSDISSHWLQSTLNQTRCDGLEIVDQDRDQRFARPFGVPHHVNPAVLHDLPDGFAILRIEARRLAHHPFVPGMCHLVVGDRDASEELRDRHALIVIDFAPPP